MAAVALIDLTGAATIKGGFAQSPLLVSGSDVNMAILNLQLIEIIILLVTALRAEESPAAESVTDAIKAAASTEPTAGESSLSTVSVSNPQYSAAPTQPSAMDRSESDSSSLENGGYPFNKPGIHEPGLRHVRAHDGFHSLKAEKHWASWNDAFTTPKP